MKHVLALLACTLAIFAAPIMPAVASAQEAVAAEPADEPSSSSDSGGAAEAKKDGDADETAGVTPPEFAGPAMPRENTAALGRVERAHEFFTEGDWVKGLDLLDRLLADRQPEEEAEKRESPRSRTPEPGPAAPAGVVRIAGGAGAMVRVVGGAAAAKPPEVEEEDDRPPSQIVFTPDGVHYEPLDAAVRRILLELPGEGREIYRRVYDPPAERELEKALTLPFEVSLLALDELSRRYPLTGAGFRALEALGDRALDLGAPARAADAYAELARRRSMIPADERGVAAGGADERAQLMLIVKAAFASALAGRSEAAADLLERARADYADTVVTIRGEPVRGAELAKLSLVVPPGLDVAEDGVAWRCPMGRPDHAALALEEEASPPLGGRARWIHSFGSSAQTGAAPTAISAETVTPLRRSNFYAAFPAVSFATRPGVVLVRSGGELVSLDASSGKIVWRTNLSAVGSSGTTPVTNPQALFQHLGGGTVSVVGDLAMIIDRQSAPAFDSKGRLSYRPNALFAFDIGNGKLRWRVGGRDATREELRKIAFTAPPTHAGGDLLVVPATDGKGPWVAGLTTSGSLRWLEKLYSYNAGYLQRHRNAVSQGASLAAAGGVAVSAPGHGVVTALDVESGRLRWVTRYRTLAYASRAWDDSQLVWAPSHPVIAGGRVIVAPYDSSYLIAIDLGTGRTIWDRSFGGDRFAFLGADDELAFVAGDVVEAIDARTGDVRWRSESLRRVAGTGFVTRARIYVPLENEIAMLDRRTGRTLARMGFTDPRIDGLKPANLGLLPADLDGSSEDAIDGTRLIAAGAWGVALIQPQEKAWEHVESRVGSASFDRARLLRAEGRYAEALDLLESLLDAAKSDRSIATATSLLVETAREAAQRLDDPRAIARLLERPGLDIDQSVKTSLELERARILERGDPAAAAAIYHDVIRRGAHDGPVLTPDGVRSRPERWAVDAIHALVAGGRIEPPDAEEAQARERVREAAELLRAGAATRAIRELERIVERTPYLPAAAEALALLAREAADRGGAAATLALFERLIGSFPGFDGVERLRRLRSAFEEALSRPDTLPPSMRALLDADVEWRQAFWHGVDRGFLVETTRRSAPLRTVLSLRSGKLHVFDPTGVEIGDVELPDFPDIEERKASLQSHIEEPGRIYSREDVAFLLTAAGVYRLELPAQAVTEGAAGESAVDERESEDADGDGGNQPGGNQPGGNQPGDDEPIGDDAGARRVELPRLAWHQSYRHAIESLYSYRGVFGWGRSTLSHVSGNLFPEFVLPPGEPHVLVLDTTGELLAIDLDSGKLRSRRSSSGRTPLGRPRLIGADLVVTTAKPAGIVVYDLREPRGPDDVRYSFEAPVGTISAAALVPGSAVVLDTYRGVEVHAADGRGGLLWTDGEPRRAPAVVRVTGAEVWLTTPTGRLECRALLSGRLRWSTAIPRDTAAVRVYEAVELPAGGETPAERALWIALATDASLPSSRSYSTFMQTGRSLVLLQMTESGRKLREVAVGSHGITFTGRRWVVGDRWVIAYNEAAEDGRWYSRVSSFDPQTGAIAVLFQAPIAGKGTGLPPRIALTRLRDGELALALGNAEGFGLYRVSRDDTTAKNDRPAPDGIGGRIEDPRRETARVAEPARGR